MISLATAAALVVVGPANASGTVVSEQAKMVPSDASTNDVFGDSVSISGQTMVVGARFDDGKGSAYVFVRNGSTWTQQAKLTANDAAPDDRFGGSVAIFGDVIVVGASLDDDKGSGSGSAYVFTRKGSTWTQQDKLTASDAAAGDNFGDSVAVSFSTVVVGAFGNADAGPFSGSAYVFLGNGITWTQEAKLTANDAAGGDLFGENVAVYANSTTVIGARFDDHGGGLDSGSAYVFVRTGSTWVQQAKLTATDSAAGDEFATSVAIHGTELVVVGADRDDSAVGSDSGSAYVFTRSGATWTQQAKLTASDAAAGDDFGTSVALYGNNIVVGADGNDDAGLWSGSVYLFTRSGTSWTQEAKMTASDAAGGDEFGRRVAISGTSIAIGAPFADVIGSNSGTAYVFVIPAPPPTPKPSPAVKRGYWMLEADGTIYGYGDSASFAAVPVAGATAIAFDRSADGKGLWLLDSNGQVSVRGTAVHRGNVDLAKLRPGNRVASISVTPSTQGYWVFTDQGQVLTFGDATGFGDLPSLGISPNGPIVASAPTPSGKGYYMLGSDGGVFAFGDAKFNGSIPGVLPPGALACAIVGLVPTPSGGGYWMVACDGGVFAFGDATFVGSVPGVLGLGTQLNSPINGLVPYGNGYLMVASDGGVFTFSDLAFLGSLGSNPPNTPIVAITAFSN